MTVSIGKEIGENIKEKFYRMRILSVLYLQNKRELNEYKEAFIDYISSFYKLCQKNNMSSSSTFYFDTNMIQGENIHYSKDILLEDEEYKSLSDSFLELNASKFLIRQMMTEDESQLEKILEMIQNHQRTFSDLSDLIIKKYSILGEFDISFLEKKLLQE